MCVCVCGCDAVQVCYSNRNVCDFARYTTIPKLQKQPTIKKGERQTQNILIFQALKHAITHSIQPHQSKAKQKKKKKKKRKEEPVLFRRIYVVRVQCLFKRCRYIKRNHARTHTHMQTLSTISWNFTYRTFAKIKNSAHLPLYFFPSFLF